MLIKYYFVALLLFLSGNAVAFDTNVAYVGTWGHGGLFIQLTNSYPLSGCASPEIWVEANHQSKDQILSIALAAVASGKQIGIEVGVCSAPGGRPLFTNSTDSHIYLKN